MEKTLRANSRARGHTTDITLARGVLWGVIGGLAGTIVMDLFLMAALSIVGDTVARFFTILGSAVVRFSEILGIEIAGGVPLGVAAHYLIGPAIGASFGAAVARVDILRVNTVKRGIVLAVLYVEMASQPLLAAMLILLGWTVPETVQWYGGALFAHFIAGAVLGLVVGYGLCSAAEGKKVV